jgi:uncharacterized protein YndB with AHSA1/START domain
MDKNEQPIVVEQIYNTHINRVWSAITSLTEMKKWFFDNLTTFEPKVGFETSFDIQIEDRVFSHIWKVIEVQPNHKIATEWRFGGYDGCAIVDFELTQIDDKTNLRLTARAIESFPNDIPEFKRESGVEGWNYFIKNSLKEYLEKQLMKQQRVKKSIK